MHVAPGRLRYWYTRRGEFLPAGLGLSKKKRYREGEDDPGMMRLKCGEHGNFESRERV